MKWNCSHMKILMKMAEMEKSMFKLLTFKGFSSGIMRHKHNYWATMVTLVLLLATCVDVATSRVMDDDIDGSGEADGDKTVLVSVEGQGHPDLGQGQDVHYSTLTARDVVDKFLSIVDQYEQNKDNCTPGVEFNLGDGVVAQYGVKRFKNQALAAVNRANLLTRLWKGAPRSLLKSEFFFYTQVNMDLFIFSKFVGNGPFCGAIG